MRVAHRKLQAAAFAVALTGAASLVATRPLAAQDPAASPAIMRSAAQLERLVGPIALYADPLLAQLLLAATFPDHVRDAAAHVRANGAKDIDAQPWDVSVKAIAHYPTVLNLMDSKPEWMDELGQAYATQSADVMAAIQRLRQAAVARGNLVTTPEHQVVVEPSQVAIWPANPRVIYVPVYDPDVVYVRYAGSYGPRPYVSFGFGYPMGPWFIYDTDWPRFRLVYSGWVGGGWIARSRPYVVLSPACVHERCRTIAVGPGRYARPYGGGRGWGGGEWNRGGSGGGHEGGHGGGHAGGHGGGHGRRR